MSEINLMIHGRTYGVGCDDGQEKRVRELGQYIDKRVREIASAGGAATEAHLLVLTALVLADELFEAREQNAPGNRVNGQQAFAQLQEENNRLQDENNQMRAHIESLQHHAVQAPVALSSDVDPEIEAEMTAAIENIARRLEGIATRLQEVA